MGKFVHKPFFLHFQFHSSYLWLFCLTQSFLINHLSLHFNETCFLPLEIFLIFLKRSGQRHSNFWLVWVRQEAYPGQCQSIYDFCWLPCMIGTLHHEKIRPQESSPYKYVLWSSTTGTKRMSLWLRFCSVHVTSHFGSICLKYELMFLLALKLVYTFHCLQGFLTR